MSDLRQGVWLVAVWSGVACAGASRWEPAPDGGTGELPDGASLEDATSADAPRSDGVRSGCGVPGGTFGSTGEPWRHPVAQCSHEVVGRHVTITPLVIDLDGDGRPEIVFTSWGDMWQDVTDGQLHAIRGDDCAHLWTVANPAYLGNQIAAGDLTGDRRPEIVTHDSRLKVIRVFSGAGVLLATSDRVDAWALTQGQGQGGGPAIADVDGVAPPEIVMGAAVLRFDADFSRLTLVWSRTTPEGFWGTLSVVADVDLDGRPEVVTGNRIYDAATGTDKTPAGLAARPPGYAAIAQMDPSTPEPEIVLVSSDQFAGSVSFVNPRTGAIVFGPYETPGSGAAAGVGGAPTVADFAGDRRPEVGVAGPADYRVYAMECAAVPLPAHCFAPGVLWSSSIKDVSSGGTSSSVFDFNEDCRAEVVYRDECWLRIYDGATGRVLAAHAISSTTSLDEPVIADSDGDGSAEIVVSSDRYYDRDPRHCRNTPEAHSGAPWTGSTSGIIVLRDPFDRWARARPIWNQNAYHVTNVLDDGTIPSAEARSWELHNNYRQNVAVYPF